MAHMTAPRTAPTTARPSSKVRRVLPKPEEEVEEEEEELWFPDCNDEEEKKGGGPLHPSLPHCPPISSTPQRPHGYDASLGFKLNSLPVESQEGGADLLLVQRGGSCGSTSLLVPPPPSSSPPPSTPSSLLLQPEPTPIITGVLCGEAAERVLSDCRVPESGPQDGLGLQERPWSPFGHHHPFKRTLCLRGGGQLRRPRRCSHCGSPFLLIRKLRGFMCACSIQISESLKIHKIHVRRWSTSRTLSSTGSLDPLAPPQTGPLSSPRPQTPPPQTGPPQTGPPQVGPPKAGAAPGLWPPPQGSLVIPLEEFYYGTDDSPTPHPSLKSSGPYHCTTCKTTVRDNVQLMKHMDQHAAVQRGGPGNGITSCSFCYRRFHCPFSLQCHLEAVHTQRQATAVCKICELSFVDERDLLKHMKVLHQPGEMPYVCQVCGFRSSFHSSLRGHFEAVHRGSASLLCLYCLRVLRSHAPYQYHLGRHQRRDVLPCGRCRLSFLSTKERANHQLLHHGTHLHPPSTRHLPPGTTVTVRAYSVVKGTEEPKNRPVPSKVIDLALGSPPPEPPSEKPRKRPHPLPPKWKPPSSPLVCIECMSPVSGRSHFVSVVRCSRCKYLTHCSRAYADHMISNHATRKSKSKWTFLFRPNHRCDWNLSCGSCDFTTHTGDLMANHMTDHAHHTCSLPHAATCSGAPGGGGPRQDAMPRPWRNAPSWRTAPQHEASVLQQLSHCSEERRGQLLSGGGAFVPIHLLPSGTSSTQLSVKILSHLPPPSCPPAMTIRFRGPQARPAQRGAGPAGGRAGGLRVEQLVVVLFALCSGLPQAGRRYHTDPALIQAWVLQREAELGLRAWGWDTEPVAEWVLIQREKQLTVQESSLLQVGVEVLGGVQYQWGGLHGWAVDLMLHHQLSLQRAVQSKHSTQPRPFTHKTLRFLKQLNTESFRPGSVGCMDELSLFLDMEGVGGRGLQLSGRSESLRCDVVLGGLADGSFLRPALFFRGPEPRRPPGFPPNVLLEARPEGFTDQQRLQLWTTKVWQPHVERGRGYSLLLMDKHRGHEGAEFAEALGASSTLPAIFPIGCSAHLQPLDACISPVVREFVQARWSQLAPPSGGGPEEEQGGGSGLGLEELALTLGCWLSEVASTLDRMPHVLTRSFSVASSSSQKREGLGQMIKELAESLIGQQKEQMEDKGGEAEV